MQLERPTPITDVTPRRVDARQSPHEAVRRLKRGETVLVTDHADTGRAILDALYQKLGPRPQDPYAARRSARKAYRTAALHLLEPISDGRSTLEGTTENGFLRQLYPDQNGPFLLPFLAVQELKHAWNRYQQGIHLAVLGRRIHPFYGTYAPERTEHLELFATWLAQYDGPRTRAIDVGTGSGVLAFLLARNRFEDIVATDINPNALESVRRELTHLDPAPPIRTHHGDLLDTLPDTADVIVFNPPWTQGEIIDPLDRALLWTDPSLFTRFFDQARERLTAHGRIVVVFSNLITLVQPDLPHPIEAELARGHLRCVNTLKRKIKPTRAGRGPRRRTRERVEVWELARA